MSGPDAAEVGMELATCHRTCDIVQSFFYNAVLWNAHRIHYDLPYATDVEGYPGLVVPGPLLGDWLTQVIDEWIDESGWAFTSFEYSNRLAAYVGDELSVGGTVTEVHESRVCVTLFVKNAAGEVITPGKAVVARG